jgi:6-phosphofructokinase 1
VVSEGVRNVDGQFFTDAAAGVDSFGHKRLSGAGVFIKHKLQEYAADDAEYWEKVFVRNGTYIEHINTLPEIRDLLPGHLVRCGDTTPYDVSFGKQCGGGAVLLLLNGISGVTIAGISEGEIRYLPVQDAIQQRHVSLADVEYYEQLGVCFGRNVAEYKPKFKQISGHIERYM